MGSATGKRKAAPFLSNLTMKAALLNPPIFPLSNAHDEKSEKAERERAFRELKLNIMNEFDNLRES